MKKLLQQRNVIKEKIKVNKDLFKRKNEKLLFKINPILRLMSSVESEIIDSYQDRFYQPDIHDCYLMKSGCRGIRAIISSISNIYNIKISSGIVKVETIEHYCGDSEIYTVKIHEHYFSATPEEIKAAHRLWATETMEKLIKKNLERKRIEIERKRIDLEKQIKQLQS